MNFETLYKFTNEKWQVWDISVEDLGEYADIIVEWGYEDGAKQTKITSITEGKNIGKANETSYIAQAISEAKSKWNKQKDKGYSETRVVERDFRPMLAQDYNKHSHHISFPAFCQPKLDGTRCNIFRKDGNIACKSRNGKDYTVLDHLAQECVSLLYFLPDDAILDGELYTHGSSFQKIISAVKRDERSSETSKIEYHCYDIYLPSTPKMSFYYRYTLLKGHIEGQKLQYIKHVPSYVVNNNNNAIEQQSIFVADGYEGAMLRNYDSPYEPGKRSYNLQKFKTFQDDEFLIIGGEEDKNNECVFHCKTVDGVIFRVKPEGTHEIRKEYYTNLNKYLGKMLTVRFFEYTDDGIPRFPIGVGCDEWK